MHYDVYLIYYGKTGVGYDNIVKAISNLKGKVDIEKRAGSKFQNFGYFYQSHPEIISKYDRIYVIDDDIRTTVQDVNLLFDISRKYDLDICSPSLSEQSKVSHPITKHKPNTLLTYTNFVEVTYVMFSAKALAMFMPKLDSSLIGWGIDYLYMWCNDMHRKKAYAIVHAVVCTNPYDKKKPAGRRELSYVKRWKVRECIWEKYARSIGCPASFDHIEWDNIPIE